MIRSIHIGPTSVHAFFQMMYMRGIFKKGLLDARDENWRSLRHLLTPAFTTRRLKNVREFLQIIIDSAPLFTNFYFAIFVVDDAISGEMYRETGSQFAVLCRV